jgi:hypothetical protein
VTSPGRLWRNLERLALAAEAFGLDRMNKDAAAPSVLVVAVASRIRSPGLASSSRISRLSYQVICASTACANAFRPSLGEGWPAAATNCFQSWFSTNCCAVDWSEPAKTSPEIDQAVLGGGRNSEKFCPFYSVRTR